MMFRTPTFVLSLGATALAAETPLPAKIEFNRDVRPILSDACYRCHGFDPKKREGDRRLDTRDGALAENEGLRAIVPGKPEESDAWARLISTDKDEVMPPHKEARQLSPREKEIIKRWIEQGAEYQAHWAYTPVVRPVVPDVSEPGFSKNAIDAFVLARLRAEKLSPAPRADDATLERRLHLDLTGLPPMEPRKQSEPFSVSALADRLLATPQYGERMAVWWLDLARYADTIGYHSDNPRNVWPWRDYVIRAFNENKRFDRFTEEQLAGDLLPDATRETRVASGFNRLIMSTEEGGAQPGQYEAKNLGDRVRAVGTVWLAHTTGCAECHDHKYDPITARDYYALGAFFADVKEAAIGKREPGLLLTTPEQEKQLADLAAAQAAAEKKLNAPIPDLPALVDAWEADLNANPDKYKKNAKPAKDVAAALDKPLVFRSTKDRELIVQRFRETTPLLAPARLALSTAKAARETLEKAIPRTLVTESNKEPRTVRLLPRGDWQNESGDVVAPGTPTFLPTAKAGDGQRLTRLDLARWITDQKNPLTARVVVNRLWKLFFGTGLAKNLDDFGTQGESPTHPELLDWLAAEFMESGWDVKHIVRLMVTSGTYRQSSTCSKEIAAADPLNRLLARQGRWRLDAEFVRDQALQISGLLNPHIGGASVKPYQPEGYWEHLNFPTREWEPSRDDNQWRRGLYTWWQRSYLHPSLLAFDAPSREECAAERIRSNIPQQALVLLNDPTYVEAARALAIRILRDAPGDAAQRITWAFQRVTRRAPDAVELSELLAHYGRQLTKFAQDEKAARALTSVGFSTVEKDRTPAELAAWTSVARIILNLHETITRS